MTDLISFLDYVSMGNTENSKGARQSAISLYLEFVHNLQSQNTRDDTYRKYLNELSIKYITDISRNHALDLFKFVDYMEDKNYAPVSIRDRVSQVKGWLEWNDVVISPQKLKSIKTKLPKGKPITKKERNITPEIIKNIIDMSPLHLKAIILVLMSSGMRIGEATLIEMDDIDFSTDPVKLQIREETTKTKTERYTFISPEAVNMIQMWLKTRDKWLLQSQIRAKNLGKEKPVDDNRLFPIEPGSVNIMINEYLKKAGYYEADERTNRATISPHLFRGYFLSKLTSAGMTPNIAQMLAGHAPPYHGAYEIYSEDDIRGEYNKLYYAISLHSSENIPEIKAELESSKNSLQYVTSTLVKNAADQQQKDKEIALLKQQNEDNNKKLDALDRRFKLLEAINKV